MSSVKTKLATLILITSLQFCANADCPELHGIKIVADDGTYLGKIGSEYDAKSIFNKYGEHGGKYSSQSIFNEYGTYGSKYSDQSPFNEYSSNPPMLIRGNEIVGFLTRNEYHDNAVDPYALIAYCK